MTQTEMIEQALLEGAEITALEALQSFGCLRLAARIADLKAQGMEINSERRTTSNGANVAVYSLASSS